MKKTRFPRLVAPGPVPVPEAVRLAMAGSMPHHRTAAFSDILADVHEGLKWLFQTDQDVLVITGTGTTGMEAAVVNFADPAGALLTVGGGKFSERWGDIAEAYGVPVVSLDVEWGQPVDPAALAALMDAHPEITAVALTACETSTGILNPIGALCEVVRRRDDVLLLVDGITAVGVMDLPFDDLGIDVLVAGSQKIFAVPPGLACLAVSARAWSLRPSPGLPRYTLDLVRERDKQRGSQTAFSAAVSLIMGLQCALGLLREEGLDALHARHARCARATRAAVEALGLSLFASVPCDAVTAVDVPEGIDGLALVAGVRERGVVIAGGQNDLKGRIFRIGHLGSHGHEDVILALSALEMALADLGYPVVPGTGVGAALSVL